MMQNKKTVIIITGGIATGKSQVTKYLKSLGYSVFDSDKIVHDGYRSKSNLYSNVVNNFGQDIVDEDGFINRKKLAKIVLSNDNSLLKLNSLVHKYVVDELMEGVYNCNDKLVFLDIPLMFEHKRILEDMGLRYDKIWLVYVDKDTQRDRLINRAKLENKDVSQTLKLIDKQISIEDKIIMSDVVIENLGTILELEDKVDDILSKEN